MCNIASSIVFFLVGCLIATLVCILIFSIKERKKQKEETTGLEPTKVKFASNDLREVIITKFNVQCQCSICLASVQLHEVLRLLTCGHYFHKLCIDQWLEKHNNCPQCRREEIG